MLSDYQTLVAELVRDDAGRIAAGEQERAIGAAVERYSKDRPRESAEDLTPTDANTLPLPGAWVADFSKLALLEYPIGAEPPSFMAQDRYYFYRTTSGQVIRLRDAVTVAADSVRATFTVKHSVTISADTIPTHDREAVACWAAALLCGQLAAFYSNSSDQSTIQADSVDNTSKAQEYAKRARELRGRYVAELGIDDKRAAPAGVVVGLDIRDSNDQPRFRRRGMNW